MTNLKQRISSGVGVAILYAIAIPICLSNRPPESFVFSDSNFLITFIGVILGLSITVVTFLYTSAGNVYAQIDMLYSERPDEKETVKSKFQSCYKELLEDVKLIFVLFFLVCILTFVTAIEPLFSWIESITAIIILGSLLSILLATADFFMALLNILKLELYKP